ncbi:MAG: Na-translocating system protein MpsC family protein [Solirubrobacteraceae bacterium]
MEPTEAPDARQQPGGSLGKDISNLVVRVVRDYTGRGPTRARAYLQDDLISVVLRDSLTRGERSLVNDGLAEHVLDTRRMYQRTMRNEITTGIEELTGRRVMAFFSDNHLDPDVAVEAVLLEPCDSPAPDAEGKPDDGAGEDNSA